MAITKPVFRNGIILLLDALGAKQFSEGDAIHFINMRDKIIFDLHSQILQYTEPIAQLEIMHTGKRPDPSQIITFGDTIAIAWQPSKFVESHELFSLHVIFWAIEFISKGMAVSTPLRGALSFGKYLLIENTLLGPAVADAAYWYEQPQMIGVVTTLSTSLNYKWLLEQNRDFMPFIIEYDVPIKNNKYVRTFAVNWPAGYMIPFFEGRIEPGSCMGHRVRG